MVRDGHDMTTLRQPGWLERLLVEAVARQPLLPPFAANALASRLSSGRARGRLFLGEVLRETGLVYGTPTSTEGAGAGGPEEVLYLAVLRCLARIGLELAELTGAAPGPRAEQLLLVLGALNGQLDEAEEIHHRIERAARAWPLPAKLWRKVEVALEARALSLAGDPYYGLVLHNGAVYADARLFGRLAIDYFSRGAVRRDAALRRVRFAAQQKALLVEVLTHLACVERRPSLPARRAILRQIDDLHLPAELARGLRSRVKRSFEHRPHLADALRGVRSGEMKRFVLEQALLSSLVDGRRSPREVAFLRSLGAALGFPPDRVQRLEIELADFYAAHRQLVDVFTVSTGADLLGEEMVDTLQRTLEKNWQALVTEIRETGELSVLLARAARGQKLDSAERARMREQLLDVAKTIPALAIFAAPGGALLLLGLAKLMPDAFLPSAFREVPQEQAEPAEGGGDEQLPH